MTFPKILFNTWSGAFFKQGGGEVQLLESKEALEKLGYEILLFNQWGPQLDIDLVHQFSIEPGVESVIKNYKESNIPVALSTIMWTLLQRGSHEYQRVEHLFKTADILFTNSDLESIRLSEAFEIDREKFHKTRNSISNSYLIQGASTLFQERYKIEGPFVLSVANIDNRKNTHLLVKACKELDIKLVTIGHIKDINYFNSFIDTFKGYIHLGPIEDEEILKSAYCSCSLFALPSKCETPGIAAMEAASQGAKVTITADGSAKEYFQNQVTYVNPWDYQSIKDGIQIGLNSKSSSELKKNIIENYTWNKTATDLLEGYDKIGIRK